MLKPKVKICCIATIAEAMMAINAGAAAVGLVGPMPSGPGIISNEQIARIARNIPSSIASFLLTSKTSTKDIIAHYELVNTTTIQLVDQLVEGHYQDIRKALPKVKIIQVIHVLNEQSIEEALTISKEVDALLLDSGNPNLAIKELGGTGKVHNWNLSREIIAQVDVPVFLAGGLKPENAQAAIDVVAPYGLDLCSGVRTEGKLDSTKLTAFFTAVNGH